MRCVNAARGQETCLVGSIEGVTKSRHTVRGECLLTPLLAIHIHIHIYR
jgi:hypothetical protein